MQRSDEDSSNLSSNTIRAVRTLLCALLDPNKLILDYKSIENSKDDLCTYICDYLSVAARRAVLKKALNQDNPLGRFFWFQRGSTQPTILSGSLLRCLSSFLSIATPE